MSCALWVVIVDEDRNQARSIERTLTPFGIGTTIVSTVDELMDFVALAEVDAIVANISAGNMSRDILVQRLHTIGADERLIVIDSSGTRQARRILAAPVSPIDLVDAVLALGAHAYRRAA